MRNNKIIDLKTYEVFEDDTKYIIVDDLIAETIALLNKLGYKTKYSCAGHSFPQNKELFINQSLNDLEQIKQINKHDIVEIRKDSFDYWHEWKYTYIYILFDKKYNFVNIPEGFILEDDDDCIIGRQIEFYEKGKKKKINKIQQEIEKSNKILYEWASKLPKVN